MDHSGVCPVKHILKVTHQGASLMHPAYVLSLLSEGRYSYTIFVYVAIAVLQDNEVGTAAVDVADNVELNADDTLRPSVRCIVIDCSSMTFIDYVGMMTIQQVPAISLFVTELSTSLLLLLLLFCRRKLSASSRSYKLRILLEQSLLPA